MHLSLKREELTKKKMALDVNDSSMHVSAIAFHHSVALRMQIQCMVQEKFHHTL